MYRAQGGHPLSTVYSFVPIPGAQQHKRPRRRYEEIERMYKCGWNGCEKAYGTLNHLNAHVTMQSHGAKRTPEGMCNSTLLTLIASSYKACRRSRARLAYTSVLVLRLFDGVPAGADSLKLRRLTTNPCPASLARVLIRLLYVTNLASSEFKEIRKEWKAKKKEEEAARKADEERHRAAEQNHRAAHENGTEAPVYGQMRQAVGVPGQAPGHPQLPPIGYQPAASGGSSGPQYGTQSPGLAEGMAQQYVTPVSNAYTGPNTDSSSYPQSPYGSNPQMYQQGH
jgi:hypothetical protein